MKRLLVFLCVLIGLVAAENYGDYVPKAYFTIDEDGNIISGLHPLNEETLNRVRRQIQPIQPFGQPGFGFQPFPFPNIQPGQGQGTFVSSSQTLSSRFGDGGDEVTGETHVVHGKDGKYEQTDTYIRPGGGVVTNRHSGRVKRQQTQIQSQEGKDGSQTQSQTQNQPGGTQFQSQSQGPVPTPAVDEGPIPNFQNVAPLPASQPPPQAQKPLGGQQQPQPHPHQDNRNQQGGPQESNRIPNQQGFGPQQGGFGPQQGGFGQQQPGFGGPFVGPFGIGSFGPQGFPQQGFGFAPGFGPGFGGAGFGGPGFGGPGFGGAGFGQQPGFGNPFMFQQPGFGGGIPPGGNLGGNKLDSRLDSRFSDDDGQGVSGGTTTFTSNNGVFHSTSSVQRPDGKVYTTHQSGKTY